MSKCETCEELNEEKNDVTITEIKIEGVGYYDWCRGILYCPTCGKRITHKQKGRRKNEQGAIQKGQTDMLNIRI